MLTSAASVCAAVASRDVGRSRQAFSPSSARRSPGGGWRVGEQVDQTVDHLLVAFDGGALGVRERDLDEHPLQPVHRVEQLRRAGLLGR
jgi:hypothetical protein